MLVARERPVHTHGVAHASALPNATIQTRSVAKYAGRGDNITFYTNHNILRNRSKAVNKLKKFLIELGNFAPKDVIVSYKMFRVVVRLNGTLTPVASVQDDLTVEWHQADVPSAIVKEAFTEFMAEME